MEFRQTGWGVVAFDNLATGKKFFLSEKHYIEVANAINAAIQKPAQDNPVRHTLPSLSSSQANSKPKGTFEVVVGQSLLYPVDITATIQGTTEYYSLSISSVYILLDFLKQPLGPLNFEELTLSIAQGKCELSLTSASLTIKNLTTGILCCFVKEDANDLFCVLQVAMQKHASHQTNSPSEYFLDSSTSQWEDTDPLAGARKRTDDNLRAMFG